MREYGAGYKVKEREFRVGTSRVARHTCDEANKNTSCHRHQEAQCNGVLVGQTQYLLRVIQVMNTDWWKEKQIYCANP